MDQIEGFILAGGASRRMGSDKALLRLDGQTFVQRIANELTRFSRKLNVVGRNRDDLGLDLPTTPDIYEKWGAFGGLHAALSACRTEWAAIVACDLPFVTAELFARLFALREGFDAVVPVQRDGIPQPLCAVYKTTECLSKAESLIKSGERRPAALLQSVHTRWVRFEELQDLHDAELFFNNINSPEDYYLATQKGGGTGNPKDELT
jgi:molybdopterin-guanine dinucleotide biosynthesis protein A